MTKTLESRNGWDPFSCTASAFTYKLGLVQAELVLGLISPVVILMSMLEKVGMSCLLGTWVPSYFRGAWMTNWSETLNLKLSLTQVSGFIAAAFPSLQTKLWTKAVWKNLCLPQP